MAFSRCPKDAVIVHMIVTWMPHNISHERKEDYEIASPAMNDSLTTLYVINIALEHDCLWNEIPVLLKQDFLHSSFHSFLFQLTLSLLISLFAPII